MCIWASLNNEAVSFTSVIWPLVAKKYNVVIQYRYFIIKSQCWQQVSVHALMKAVH